MLTHDEIRRRVRMIRFSSKRARNSRKAPSMHGLAKAAGLGRQTTYDVANGDQMYPETAAALAHALDLYAPELN
jgi:hypothetical protein